MTDHITIHLELLIETVTRKSEAHFIAHPESGEGYRFNPRRQILTDSYVSCLVFTGEANPRFLHGADINRLTHDRREQIFAQLAKAWLDCDHLFSVTPGFVTADWFRRHLHDELLRRESRKPRERSRRYKTS